MEENKRDWAYILFVVTAIFIAVLSVIFTIQNTDVARVTFLFWYFEAPLALVIVAVLAAGIIISQIISLPSRFGRQREIKSMMKRIDELEQDLFDLSSEKFKDYSSKHDRDQNPRR